jgi:hypothetical protein
LESQVASFFTLREVLKRLQGQRGARIKSFYLPQGFKAAKGAASVCRHAAC